jgi:hypothetical protein
MPNPAQVVKLQSFRNQAEEQFIGETVDKDLLPANRELPVTIWHEGRRPQPTAFRLVNLCPESLFGGKIALHRELTFSVSCPGRGNVAGPFS